MKKGIKIVSGIFTTIVALIIAVVVISYFVLNSKLPEYSGEVVVAGINNNVKIYRDKYAVPYIIANDELDAAFALGYVHAQERLFQMDISRRAGMGKLSEVLGSSTLPFDKMFRTLGLHKVVKRSLAKISKHSLNILKAYSQGVNAYIKEADGNYTFEFDLLGYEPEPWKPEHSLLLGKLMAWELNISWWTDIAFSHLVQKFGADKVKSLLPDFDENAPTVIPEYLNKAAGITTDFYKVDKAFRKFIGFEGTHIGSNNWVVNAEKSENGKVIIANDPHLAFQAPGKFMFSVVRSDVWNGEGFSIPGVPAFIIGKNNNIAWVLTNVMADDADFYLEQLDSGNTKYLYNGKWHNLSIVTDTIFIKDSSPEIFEIKKTHRGPIVSGIHLYNSKFKNEYQQKANISMRWTALDFTDEISAMIKINRAKNWEEFKNGVKLFSAPGQNFVYGDAEGNIGYICGAKLPIRLNPSPTLVYNGITDKYDWKGFVPFEKIPMLYNPSDNFIATANNKTVKNYPYHISNLWEPASRIERITELLTSKKKHSSSDFEKYQHDFQSHYAKHITPYITNAFNNVKIKDANLKTALLLLRQWDFMMDEDSQVPTIFNVFFQKLIRNIFMDEMGKELFNEYVFIANVPYRKVRELLEEKNSSWWNNINTNITETRDDIIRKSLVQALEMLENKFGKNIAQWQWRNIHTVTFKHLFSKGSPLLANLLDIGPYPIGGDGTTIFNSEFSFTNPYNSKLGPALRFIFDFAKPDEVNFILTTGQSGYFMSNHYDDMTKLWLQGKYITVNINIQNIENSNYDLLKLIRRK